MMCGALKMRTQMLLGIIIVPFFLIPKGARASVTARRGGTPTPKDSWRPRTLRHPQTSR